MLWPLRALHTALGGMRRGRRARAAITACAMLTLLAVPVSLAASRGHRRHSPQAAHAMRLAAVMRQRPVVKRHISPMARYGWTRTGFHRAPARAWLSRAPRLASHASLAHTYNVNTTADSTPGTPGCTGSGDCTLREAIEAANADGGPDQINVPAGAYDLSNGELNPQLSMFITGAGAASTTVEQMTTTSRVFDISPPSSATNAVEISGLTISGGNGVDGAGVYVGDGSAATLANDVIAGNDGGGSDGAGVYNDYYGSLWMSGTMVQGNTNASDGGGLYNDGTASLTNTTIGGSGSGQGNTSTGDGGGVFSYGPLALDNVTVAGNSTVQEGGGIWSDGALTMTGGSVSGNAADDGTSDSAYGGGIYSIYTMALTGTTVSGNKARGSDAYGGGIVSVFTAQLNDVSVTGNTALNTENEYDAFGGGITNEYTLDMTGGSITGNTVTFDSSLSGVTGGYEIGGGAFDASYAGGSTFDGVAINGNFATGGTGRAVGAGVASFTNLTLKNGTVNGNQAVDVNAQIAAYGGGVLFGGLDPSIDNMQIDDNLVQGTSNAGGAALATEYGNGVSMNACTPPRACGSFGLATEYGNGVSMNNVTADGNTAKATDPGGGTVEGGAIYLYYTPATLTNVSVTNTVAQASGTNGSVYGGAIYHYDGALTLDRSSVLGTQASAGATLQGAGIDADSGYSLSPQETVTRSTIAGNTGDVTGASGAAQGGGIWEYDPVTLVNDTITGNSVTASGGGTATDGGAYLGDTSQMTNVTLVGNHADTDVGGLLVDDGGSLGVKNTIVSGNTSAATGNCSVESGGQIISAGHNLESADTCAFHNADDLVSTTPSLGPLQNNGGPTETMAELPGSPTIDAGTNNGCPSTDQRGVSRPQGSACDIGAFEAAPEGMAFTKAGPSTATQGQPFIYTLTIKNGNPYGSTGTTVVDPLPAGMTLWGWNASQGSCAVSGSASSGAPWAPPVTLTCSLGEIDAGGSATVFLVVTESSTGSITNTASASNDQHWSASASSSAAQVAAAVLAATTPKAITGPAKNVRANAATVTGTVGADAGGVTYFFQYGKTRAYGQSSTVNTATAPLVNISAALTGLSPNTRYHYRVVAVNGAGTARGADRTFRTPSIGRLILLSRRLRVTPSGFVYVPLWCKSQLRCGGNFSITHRAIVARTNILAPVTCTKSRTTYFRIPAHRRRTLKVPVTRSCVAFLQSAAGHQIAAKVTSRPRSGQIGLIKLVRLYLR